MESCEVLVIGAGPAGATCAGILARGGLSVLVVDREDFPREKPCAGWITPAVFRTLGVDPLLYRSGRLLQEITGFRTGLIYGRELVTDYGRTVSYGIRRGEFDQFLLQRSGARTLLGERVASLERNCDGWLVNGWIKARLLIGAGGHHCPVARALGGVQRQEQAIVAMVAEFESGDGKRPPDPVAAGTVKISFTRDLRGYGWLFRKGSYLNVGLGSLESRELRSEVVRFCRYLKEQGELQEDVVGRLKGHAYLPFRNRGRRLVGDRALVIGDAAGLSFPESGEGILPAVESGILAARAVLAAAGDYGEEKLHPYAAAISSRLGGNGGDPGILPALVRKVGGAAILSSRYLTRRLVLDRWFLHIDQSPLVETPPWSAPVHAPAES